MGKKPFTKCLVAAIVILQLFNYIRADHVVATTSTEDSDPDVEQQQPNIELLSVPEELIEEDKHRYHHQQREEELQLNLPTSEEPRDDEHQQHQENESLQEQENDERIIFPSTEVKSLSEKTSIQPLTRLQSEQQIRPQSQPPRGYQVPYRSYQPSPYAIFQFSGSHLAPGLNGPPVVQQAQDRMFEELVSTAATIVPGLFGTVFFEPHRYFNMCPFVIPGQNTLWSRGCAWYHAQMGLLGPSSPIPGPMNANNPNKPGSGEGSVGVAATSDSSSTEAETGSNVGSGIVSGGGWQAPEGVVPTPLLPQSYESSPLVSHSPYNLNNNLFPMPPGFPPALKPYYANPPQMVSNSEVATFDLGNMFSSSSLSLNNLFGTGSSSNTAAPGTPLPVNAANPNVLGTGSATSSSLYLGANPAGNGLAVYSSSGYGGTGSGGSMTPIPVSYVGIGLLPVPGSGSGGVGPAGGGEYYGWGWNSNYPYYYNNDGRWEGAKSQASAGVRYKGSGLKKGKKAKSVDS